MKPDPAKHVLTVWKDGCFKVWGAVDAEYAQADPDFFVNIGVEQILHEMGLDFEESVKNRAPQYVEHFLAKE